MHYVSRDKYLPIHCICVSVYALEQQAGGLEASAHMTIVMALGTHCSLPTSLGSVGKVSKAIELHIEVIHLFT